MNPYLVIILLDLFTYCLNIPAAKVCSSKASGGSTAPKNLCPLFITTGEEFKLHDHSLLGLPSARFDCFEAGLFEQILMCFKKASIICLMTLYKVMHAFARLYVSIDL